MFNQGLSFGWDPAFARTIPSTLEEMGPWKNDAYKTGPGREKFRIMSGIFMGI